MSYLQWKRRNGRGIKKMAKNNEKQKELEAEPEMMINPRMESMCEYERKQNPEGCKDCDGQADPLNPIFCKINTISWRLGQMDKTMQAMNYNLQQILNEFIKKQIEILAELKRR
jgi:hypothetical protein